MPEESFRRSDDWKFDALSNSSRPEIDRRYESGHVQGDRGRKWHSFSGNERNTLFMNQNGEAFLDQSALSGLDNIADGRSFARFDFDRDGFQDIALANANYPLLNVYRNEIAGASKPPSRCKFVAVRLIGGNRSSQQSAHFSNRDGVGARITLRLATSTITREMRCGEGFAAQNSNTHVIGIGDSDQAQDLTVHWPSGSTLNYGSIAAGDLATLFEDIAVSNTENGCHLERYNADPIQFKRTPAELQHLVLPSLPTTDSPRLQLITTMATWCDACKNHLPQLAHLRGTFSESQLSLTGISVDPIDTREDLAAYVKRFRPAYRLAEVTPEELSSLQKVVNSNNGSDSLPSTLIVDSRGVVLEVFQGVPNASEVAKRLTVESH